MRQFKKDVRRAPNEDLITFRESFKHIVDTSDKLLSKDYSKLPVDQIGVAMEDIQTWRLFCVKTVNDEILRRELD